jgi:hypothetical protein
LIHPASHPSPQAAGRISISASVAARLPRLLPSPSDHPIVYLPIPDPSSFPYLVSWMYFGDTTALDDALQRRAIRWDGLARNVEYLGMPEELKRFLGRWYRRWLQSVQSENRKEDETDETPRGRSSSREHSFFFTSLEYSSFHYSSNDPAFYPHFVSCAPTISPPHGVAWS